MKYKIISVLLFSILALSSCQSQDNQFDLLNINFTENVKDILEHKEYHVDDKSVFFPNMRVYLSFDKTFMNIGNKTFYKEKSNENELPNSISFVTDTNNTIIQAVDLSIFNTKQSRMLLEYMNKNFSNKEILSYNVDTEKGEWEMGRNSYLWEDKKNDKMYILFYHFHKYFNEPTESTELIIFNSDFKLKENLISMFSL